MKKTIFREKLFQKISCLILCVVFVGTSAQNSKSFKENKLLQKKYESTIRDKTIDFIERYKKKLAIGLGTLGVGAIFYRCYYGNKIKIENKKAEEKINDIGDNEIPNYLEQDYKKLKSGEMSVEKFKSKIKDYYIKRIKEIKNKKLKSMSPLMVAGVERIEREATNITKGNVIKLDEQVAKFYLLFDVTYINTNKVITFLKENKIKNELEVENNLKKLLDENEDMNIDLLRFNQYCGHNGNEPVLMVDIVYQNYAIAKALIEIGKIDVNTKNNRGKTPLMQVVSQTNKGSSFCKNEIIKVVELFTKVPNIHINATDCIMKTVLMYATNYSCKEVVELILNVDKIDINKQDKEGNTALFYACANLDRESFKEIFKTLLDHKADITIKNKWEETILHWLLGQWLLDKNYEIVSMLLKQTEINKIINEVCEGETPLSLAISKNFERIVELLVGEDGKNAGIDINAPNNKNNGMTPLMLAAEKNNERIVQALLNAGAIKDQKDHLGKTALDYATCDKIKNLFL